MPTDNNWCEDDWREVVTDLCFQFAYRGMLDGKRILHPGGLGALEQAFTILGWSQHHEVVDNACEIAGCEQWCSCVGAYPRSLAKPGELAGMVGFGFLCYDHYATWNGPQAGDPPPDLGRVK